MANFVSVNLSDLNEMIQVLDEYINVLGQQNEDIKGQMQNLKSIWNGKDALAFQNMWNEVEKRRTLSGSFKSAVTNYRNYLADIRDSYLYLAQNVVYYLN